MHDDGLTDAQRDLIRAGANKMRERREEFERSQPADEMRLVTDGVRAAARVDAEKDPETLARETEHREQDSWAMRHLMNGLPVPGGFRGIGQVRRLGRSGFVSRQVGGTWSIVPSIVTIGGPEHGDAVLFVALALVRLADQTANHHRMT